VKIMDYTTLLIYGTPAVTLIITIVAMARKAFSMPSKFAPALSVVLGLAAGVVIGLTQSTVGIGMGIVYGIMLGASASGIYDAGKVTTTTIIAATKEEKENKAA
jgi:hypothetical protein